MRPALVAHGGAGQAKPEGAQDAIDRYADDGYEALVDGASAIDVVEHVVNQLEEDERFNAGRGAVLQVDGVARLEAAIMDSQERCGAVTGLEDVVNAVSVARDVMEETHHVMLGNGAATPFARTMGYRSAELVTERRRREWNDIVDSLPATEGRKLFNALQEQDAAGGTVGCVARDQDGALAAATSTGGRRAALAGRIGDTPLIGCGTYCNEAAAVSATGIGEAIVRTTLARRCTERIEGGAAPGEASQGVIDHLAEVTGRHAGVIVVGADGGVGAVHNAEAMPHAIRRP